MTVPDNESGSNRRSPSLPIANGIGFAAAIFLTQCLAAVPIARMYGVDASYDVFIGQCVITAIGLFLGLAAGLSASELPAARRNRRWRFILLAEASAVAGLLVASFLMAPHTPGGQYHNAERLRRQMLAERAAKAEPYAEYGSKGTDFARREYALQEHGILVLFAPRSWREGVTYPNAVPFPMIEFSTGTEEGSKVLLSIKWHLQSEARYNSEERLGEEVTRFGNRQLHTAVEQELQLKELHGKAVVGYYYTLTDRAPKPGEWEYMTQGMAGTGDLLLVFTVLTHNPESRDLYNALQMLATAHQK